MTAIPEQLLAAYRAADYRVECGDGTLRIGVDRADSALARLLRHHRVAGAALVSACNPCGQLLDAGENARRHAALLQRLAREGAAWLPARGDDPDGGYPGEASVLILGMDRDAARALGAELAQNAIVWIGPDAVPRLELLR